MPGGLLLRTVAQRDQPLEGRAEVAHLPAPPSGLELAELPPEQPVREHVVHPSRVVAVAGVMREHLVRGRRQRRGERAQALGGADDRAVGSPKEEALGGGEFDSTAAV